MNQRRPSRPASRAKSPAHSLTSQQIVVLILFAILGSATLILAGFVLLSNRPTGTTVQASQAGQVALSTRSQHAGDATAATSKPVPALPAECTQAGGGYSQGTVTRVVNGSTLEVQINGQIVQVVYAGIEVSADSEPAVQMAQEILGGQAVTLVKDGSDQDLAGRLARYVFAGNHFINYELVRHGLAIVQPDSPDHACAAFLEEAQQQARVERLGRWNPTPVPTKTFMPFVTLDPSKQSGCDCSKKYVCSDFRTHAEAQTCLNVCNDYSSKLDEDRDGIACENLP